MDLPALYQKQVSLTEWYKLAGHKDSEAMRAEDTVKRDRLAVVHNLIGLPFDRPRVFSAIDVANQTPAFAEYLEEHGDELCVLHLISSDPSLPKLRLRGQSVREVANGWFREQSIDHSRYTAQFTPHPSHSLFSTIFVVNQHGIFGEIIAGGHYQLTQGFHDAIAPVQFSFDWQTWTLSEPHEAMLVELQRIASHLLVSDEKKRAALAEAVGAVFFHDYLAGYFETASSDEFGLWFIDYNRILGEAYKDFTPQFTSGTSSAGILEGQSGAAGKARGIVRIVPVEAIGDCEFHDGDILVCAMTTPDYVPLMKKASAIVTDLGGMLSHAAIIARELGKPCVVATKNATQVLKEGEMVEVDADSGTIILVT